MTSQVALAEAEPHSHDGAIADRVFRLLARQYPGLQRDVMVPWKDESAGTINGVFNGRYKGRTARWLVTIVSAEDIADFAKMRSLKSLFVQYGVRSRDGALFIIPDEEHDHRELLKTLRQSFSGMFTIRLATVADIEVSEAFDNLSNDYPGRTVQIGHNSDQFRDALEAIDAVTTRLAASNTTGLRADVRDRLLVDVQAGRTLLGATTVRLAALGNTIVPALKYISDVCAKAALGELAKFALKALVNLFAS